jgi:hypothetical protein
VAGDDVFATGDELLGEQIAEPASGLDRPQPAIERCRPGEQLAELPRPAAQLETREFDLAFVDRARRVEQLVRIDPDHH